MEKRKNELERGKAEKRKLERYNLDRELYKFSKKFTETCSCLYFYACDTFPDYQLISAQISNMQARARSQNVSRQWEGLTSFIENRFQIDPGKIV